MIWAQGGLSVCSGGQVRGWWRARDERSLARLKRANSRLLALRWLTGDLGPAALPEYVCFNASTRCGLRCPHCASHGTPEAKRAHNDPAIDMPAERLQSLARQALPSARLYSVTHTGEPLALPSFEQALDAFQPLGAALHIVTSGVGLTSERLVRVAAAAGTVQLSADAATPALFERLRAGADYATFLRQALCLGRLARRQPSGRPLRVGLTCTAMGSNLHELPALVGLTHALGLGWLTVGRLSVAFEHQRGEALERHAARFNHFRHLALARGRALGVHVEMLPPVFSDVPASASFVEQPDMIVGRPPDDAVEAPPLHQVLDVEATEAWARELEPRVRERRQDSGPRCQRAERRLWAQSAAEREAAGWELERRHTGRLRELRRAPQTPLATCVHLLRRAYLRFDGDVLPCSFPTPGPLGNAARTSLAKVWNSPARHALIDGLRTGRPHPACVGCWHRRQVPAAELLREL